MKSDRTQYLVDRLNVMALAVRDDMSKRASYCFMKDIEQFAP